MPNSVWLFGGCEENNPRNFFLRVVPNRQAQTLYDVLKQEVMEGSILVTDGYPSYPRVAALFGTTHVVVNHTEGFTNENGDHTNFIENIWSDLKSLLRTRHGIKRTGLNEFITEFIFRKRVIQKNTRENIESAYLHLLEFLFH